MFIPNKIILAEHNAVNYEVDFSQYKIQTGNL